MASKFNCSAAALALAIASFPATALFHTGSSVAIYSLNQESIRFQTLADETDALAMQVAFERSAPATVLDAYEGLQADPGNVALQDAYNRAVTGAGLPYAGVIALEIAHANWQNASEADALAAVAEIEAQDAFNIADK
jgi:hypothetical protein